MKLTAKTRSLEHDIVFNETDFIINEREVVYGIKMLKCKKAPGFDMIRNEMLKYSQHALVPHIVKLFNCIFRLGIYPTSWCYSYITPIFKGGDPNLPTNYRGIAVNSCVGKHFNTVINNRLNKFILLKTLISDCQIGFNRKCRASDQMFIIKEIIFLLY